MKSWLQDNDVKCIQHIMKENLSDWNGIRIHVDLDYKRKFNHLAKLVI